MLAAFGFKILVNIKTTASVDNAKFLKRIVIKVFNEPGQ